MAFKAAPRLSHKRPFVRHGGWTLDGVIGDLGALYEVACRDTMHKAKLVWRDGSNSPRR